MGARDSHPQNLSDHDMAIIAYFRDYANFFILFLNR